MIPFLDESAQREHKQRNLIHTGLLLGGLLGLVGVACALLFGWRGVLWAGLAVAALTLLAPRIPPEAIMRMYRGRLVDPRTGRQLT